MMHDTLTETTIPARENGVRLAALAAAGFSAVMAVIYLLIGLEVITVLDPPDDQPQFGLIAAGFFLAVAVVLLTVRRRWVWIVLAGVQLFVAFTYVNLAGERIPEYEAWGIALRVLQIPIIVALAWLILRAPRGGREGRPVGD